MSTDLDERPNVGATPDQPRFDSDTPQGEYDNAFNDIVRNNDLEAAAKENPDEVAEKSGREDTPSPSDLKDQEENAPKKKEGPLNPETGRLNALEDRKNSGVPTFDFTNEGKKKGGLKGRAQRMVGGSKNKAVLALVGLLIGGGGLFAANTVPQLQITHIGEVLSTRIGGVQSSVIRFRSGRIYSRAFFFTDEGKFDGYKERGFMGWYKNRKTDVLVKDMHSRGWKVDFSATGKVTKMTFLKPLENGAVETIENANKFESIFKSRSALKSTLAAAYPDESRAWRAIRTHRLYRRYNLLRTDWLTNNRVVNWFESKELAIAQKIGRKLNFLEKVRTKMRGVLIGELSGTNIESAAAKTITNAASGAEAAANDAAVKQAISGDTAEAVGHIKDGVDDPGSVLAPSADDTVDNLAEKTGSAEANKLVDEEAKVVESGAAKAGEAAAEGAFAGWTTQAAKMCALERLSASVYKLVRTKRYQAIRKSATAILSMIGAIKAGGSGGKLSAAEISGFAAMINTRDTKTGQSLFGSGTYRGMVKGDGTSPTSREANVARVDNNFTRAVGKILAVIKKGSIGDTACRVVGNPIVQLFDSGAENVAEIGGCIVTGGAGCGLSAGLIATKTATSVVLTLAKEVAKIVLVPLAAAALTGAVCSGDNTGPLMMACLFSGTKALYNTRSATQGMRPLTKKAVAYYQSDIKEEQKQHYASMSVWQRYFSFSNPMSLSTLAAIQTPVGITGMANSASGFLSSFTNIFNGNMIFGNAANIMQTKQQKAYADANPDEIALDAFGHPTLGIPPELMQNDNYNLENTIAYLDKYHLITKDGDINTEGLDLTGAPLSKGTREVVISRAKRLDDYRKLCIDVDEVGNKGNYGNTMVDADGIPTKLCYEDKGAGDEESEDHKNLMMFKLDNDLGKGISESLDTSPGFNTNEGTDVTDGTEDGVPVNGEATNETPSGNIVKVSNCPTILVDSAIADNIVKLIDAAKANNIDLCHGSGGWRSPAQQIALRRAHCGSSDFAIYQMKSSACKPPTAKPGHSMHEKGLAIDFGCNGASSISSHSSPCFVWLQEHAAGIAGLKNLPSESWHWSTTGD